MQRLVLLQIYSNTMADGVVSLTSTSVQLLSLCMLHVVLHLQT